MTGRPRREQAKRAAQLYCSADIRRRVEPLLSYDESHARSLSSLLEGLLLLAKSMYVEEREQDVVHMFYAMKARELAYIAQTGVEPALRRVHVTLDCEACEFADFIVARFPQLFHTRSEFANTLLMHASSLCEQEHYAGYIARRLRYIERSRTQAHAGVRYSSPPSCSSDAAFSPGRAGAESMS